MKFGKYLEGRELELPEFSGYFIDYKSLKKLIKQLSLPTNTSSTTSITSNGLNEENNFKQNGFEDPFEDPNSYKRLQKNKASFFFRLERELEKVNTFYLQKESDLTIKFNILNSKYISYRSNGKLYSRNSLAFKSLYGRFIKYQKDLISFEQYVELNKTGFSKVLKKWDKRSHSQDKEFYLATVVSVQPVFTRIEMSRLNDEILNILMELNDLQNSSSSNNTNSMENNNGSNTNGKTPIATDTASSINGPRTPWNDPVRNDLSSVMYATPSEINVTPNVYNSYTDFDSEIEDWYLELKTISRLKDDNRRKETISSFYKNKIEQYFADTTASHIYETSGLDNIVCTSLSKLFILLVGSKISDEDLETFYHTIKDQINLGYVEDDDHIYSKKNILHEATHCADGNRDFVIKEALANIPEDTLKILVNAKDLHKRTPLHFAAELGKLSCIKLLLTIDEIIDTINSIDDDYDTPLILAIKNNHTNIIRELLKNKTVLNSLVKTENIQFSPLLVACKYNNLEAAQIILDIYKTSSKNFNKILNTQGLGPLHLVSQLNDDVSELIILLIKYGLNPNAIDEFNKFSAIFFAIKACNAKSVKTLLENGASIDIVDEYGRSPLFYVLWESNVDVLNEFIPYARKHDFTKEYSSSTINKALNSLKGPLLNDDLSLSGDELTDMTNSLEDIPDFALPPPIIPLKKYGHNYLIQKIFIKLSFERDTNFIEFHPADETIIVPEAGRITVTSNYSDNLPRNIVLRDSMGVNGSNFTGEEDKLLEGNNEVMFQVDSIDNFIVDFEVYPEFGTRLISKTTCMPYLFQKIMTNVQDTIFLPLFDTKLNNIGSLRFKCQIIFPYNGKSLQIDKYEPYWKSTSSNNSSLEMTPLNSLSAGGNSGVLSKKDNINNEVSHYILSSSLCGTFTNVKVFSLEDGTLVSSPECWIDYHGVKFLFSSLNRAQLQTLLTRKLSDITPEEVDTETKLQEVVKTRTVLFDKLIHTVPFTLQLVIQVCYPTDNEIILLSKNIGAKISPNDFIDKILFTVFEHERTLRHTFGIMRSIIFSSCNWKVCSILNWKQPNFPVLLEMTSLMTDNNDRFLMDTPHNLRAIIAQNATDSETLMKNIKMIDKKIRIKDIIQFALDNNVFGVIIPHSLLKMCYQLVSTIKGQELLLVGSISEHEGMFINFQDDDSVTNCLLQDSKLIINQE